MIRPLRSRHRGMIAVLAIVVPLVFALGLRARRPVPSNAALPAGFAAPTFDDSDVLVSQRKQLPGELSLTVRRLRPSADGGPERLFVEITADPHLPELLAYWTAGSAAAKSLPADARLLGPLRPAIPALFDLPATGEDPGRLILYSLAHATVVDTVSLRRRGTP